MTNRVVFTPSGLDGEVESGTSVLDAARRLGVDLDSVCGGRGICGRCQITPSIGSFSKWGIEATASALTEPGELEIDYQGPDVEIAFNPVFVSGLLKVLPNDSEVRLDLIDAASPALFKFGEDYQYLIMPLT